jgi:hypothetical protein
MRLMDGVTQARALRARPEARYGGAEELFDRMQATAAAACRRGCGASGPLKTCRYLDGTSTHARRRRRALRRGTLSQRRRRAP